MRRTGKRRSEPTIGSVVCAIANRSDGPWAFGGVRLAFDFGRAFAFDFFFFIFLAFAIAILPGIRKKPAPPPESSQILLGSLLDASLSLGRLNPAGNTKKPCTSHAFTALQQ